MRYTGERSAAEDILHDSFLKIFDALGRFDFRGEAALYGWMRKVTVSCCVDQLRKNRLKTVSLEDGMEIRDEEDIGMEDVRGIPPETLMGMIEELPEGYRTVFNLFCLDGYSHREIASMLGIAEKSSSSQYARARALLSKKIKRYLDERV